MEEPLGKYANLGLTASSGIPAFMLPAEPPSRSILVLEDDDICLSMIRKILRAADFNVVCAHDFFEAFQPLEQGVTIDMALIDVNLPQGTPDGISFARRAQVTRPTLKFIFMSAKLTLPAFERLEDNDTFLRKPFVPDQLLEVVTRAAWDL
jgi:CheY-like chemotaxis protein